MINNELLNLQIIDIQSIKKIEIDLWEVQRTEILVAFSPKYIV